MVSAGQDILRAVGIDHPLRDAFLRWQCRVRQMMMRDDQGRPGDPVMPALTLPGDREPMGHVITVLSKAPQHSKTPEMRHMVRKTVDPAARRQSALTFFSEFYYQRAEEFSDILTATFPPASPGAAQIREAGRATLTFEESYAISQAAVTSNLVAIYKALGGGWETAACGEDGCRDRSSPAGS